MKPLKLTMSAFGPYSAETEIDFRALGRSGVYLVCGDTGAGKTMIFDAICFALFGEASGDSRNGARSSASLMLRSNMPSGDADAMMTMESRLSLTSGLLSMVSSLASDSSFVIYFFSSKDRSKRKYR